MTHRRREHPPRIDLSVGPVGWAMAMEVSAVVVAKLRELGHLPSPRAAKTTPTTVSLDQSSQRTDSRDRPRTLAELDDRMRTLFARIEVALADAKSSDDVRVAIERMSNSDMLLESYLIGSAMQSFMTGAMTKSEPVATSESVSQADSDVAARAVRVAMAVNKAVKAIEQSGVVAMGGVAEVLASGSLFKEGAFPPEIERALLQCVHGSLAFPVYRVVTDPANEHAAFYVNAAAAMMLDGAVASARLIASLFPGCLTDDVVPRESLFDFDRLFAEHAVRMFPFSDVDKLVASGHSGTAITLVFKRLDKLLRSGMFRRVDDILAAVRLDDDTDPAVVFGYITMTWPAKRLLRSFMPLVARLRPWMTDKIGEKRTNNLLRVADDRTSAKT